MKHRISVSISEPVLLRLKDKMRFEKVRNQSLIIEKALETFLK